MNTERTEFTCMECDNECRLSIRCDSSDTPKYCPIDIDDDSPAIWEN